MANNNSPEKKRIRKKLNESYLKAEGHLKEIYKYEYLFRKNRKNDGETADKYSNAAHDFKDALLNEIDTVEGIMSLNMRGTRKRKRNNNNSSNNNRSTRSRRNTLTPGSFPF